MDAVVPEDRALLVDQLDVPRVSPVDPVLLPALREEVEALPVPEVFPLLRGEVHREELLGSRFRQCLVVVVADLADRIAEPFDPDATALLVRELDLGIPLV